MNLSKSNVCDVCGKSRNAGSHVKCSKILKQKYAASAKPEKKTDYRHYSPANVEYLVRNVK